MNIIKYAMNFIIVSLAKVKLLNVTTFTNKIWRDSLKILMQAGMRTKITFMWP